MWNYTNTSHFETQVNTLNVTLNGTVEAQFKQWRELLYQIWLQEQTTPETYPTAEFSSTAIVAADDGFMVTGNLNLHGVTRSITFPARIEVGADQVTATAEFSIMRFDFDIVYPGKPDDLIRDEVVVKLNVVAAPAAGGDA